MWFGVRPDGEAVGLDATEKTLRDVAEAIAPQIRPQIHPRVTAVPIVDARGRDAVRVDFFGDDAPYSWKGSVPKVLLQKQMILILAVCSLV